MIRFFLSLYDCLSRHTRLVTLGLLLCVAGCAGMMFSLHYQEDIADFLPRNEQSEKYSAVYKQLGGQNKVAVLFSCTDEGSNDTDRLIEAMERFGIYWKETDTLHRVADMQIRVDEAQLFDLMDFIWKNYPYFLTHEDYLRMDSLLAVPGYVAQQLENNKRLLMLPAGGFMTQNLIYDPLQLFSPVIQQLQSLKISDQYQLIDGCIFNREANRGMVFFSSPYGISESKQNEKLSYLLETVIRKTETACPKVRLSAVGAPLIAVANAQQIKKDSLLAVSLSVVLIFAILIFSFKRGADLFWMGASVLFGWLFALGCIAVYKDSISIIVLGIGSIIIGIAVNYPLHFLDHLKHEPEKRTALKEMVPPLLIGNITTVSAFLCLLFLDAEAMRDLGLFGSLTLIGTILFVLVFLPVLVPRRKTSENCFRLLPGKIAFFSEKKSKKLLYPVIALTLLFAYFSLDTSFDSDMQHINYMTARQRADLDLLAASFQRSDSTECLYAVAEGRNWQEALQHNENLLKLIKRQVLSGQVTQISGIDRFIPSLACQEERLKQWAAFWKAHPQTLTTFDNECARLGFSVHAFSPFLESTTAVYEPQEADYFEPWMRFAGENFIREEGTTVRIVNYVQTLSDTASALKEQLHAAAPAACFVFDAEDVSNQLVSVLSDNFNYIGFVCGFVVFFFLWVSFGRLELSLLSFLPLAVSWIWILGIMELFGIRFNIVNIILATFIFGQGDDYTIFITEGLMHEYAYGKKMLASYKNSVALSAVIMFIGIGTLIFARHPAMRSLAEVAIIGMVTVVVMAYYLPPLVFKWLTASNGVQRDVPLTLKRIGYSLFSLLFFLMGMYLIMIPFTFFYFRIGKVTEKKKLNYHKIVHFFSGFIIRHVPGVKFVFNNKTGERFDKPAVIICNHQSHLDLMCVLMLTPRLVILTNDWVWKNPFYGMIIRHAEFYPVSDGIDTNLERLRSLVERGYSVMVFPEGTRSKDGTIGRFHRGAFYLAQRLGTDILPLFIHGAGFVLPKKDFMLREGSIYLEIGNRMPATEVVRWEECKKLASYFCMLYRTHYEEICRLRENTAYFLPYMRYKYMYKGYAVEAHCKKMFKALPAIAGYVDRDFGGVTSIRVTNSGQGEVAWLLALVHKKIEVYACEQDTDLYSLASHTAGIPENLHFICRGVGEHSGNYPEADEAIDIASLTRNT